MVSSPAQHAGQSQALKLHANPVKGKLHALGRALPASSYVQLSVANLDHPGPNIFNLMHFLIYGHLLGYPSLWLQHKYTPGPLTPEEENWGGERDASLNAGDADSVPPL